MGSCGLPGVRETCLEKGEKTPQNPVKMKNYNKKDGSMTAISRGQHTGLGSSLWKGPYKEPRLPSCRGARHSMREFLLQGAAQGPGLRAGEGKDPRLPSTPLSSK